ncbi:hypothetical protein BSKO_05171 [Bryopsis sp. KO-2023]|nr:hypothetical protein BSKO_05171 [Bryopsis sp. KO-2023]
MALRRLASELSGRFGSASHLQPVSQELFGFAFARSCFHYAKSHEYVNVEGDSATVGISDFAQKELGDIVYVELPEVGSTVTKGETFGVVESVKAASDVYAPVSGEVVEANGTLADQASLVNEDPQGEGWMIKIKLSDAGEVSSLLPASEYGPYCESL